MNIERQKCKIKAKVIPKRRKKKREEKQGLRAKQDIIFAIYHMRTITASQSHPPRLKPQQLPL